MKTFVSVIWTLGSVAQGWVAYLMCFTVTDLGGYLPMVMFVAPMILAGVFLWLLIDVGQNDYNDEP